MSCGVAVQCWELAEHAVNNGYDVSISTLSSRGKEYREGNILIFNLISGKINKVFRALKFLLCVKGKKTDMLRSLTWKEKITVLSGAAFLKRHIESVDPDIIHIHTFSNPHAMSLGILSFDIPVVMCDHGFWQDVRSEHDRIKVKNNIRIADYFISDSRFGQRMQAEYGLEIEAPNRLIYNPVSSRFISRLPELDTHSNPSEKVKKEVLFVGGVDVMRKGLDTLMEAFSVHDQLRHESRLIVIANQQGRDFARSKASEFLIDCQIVEPIPHDELFGYYRSSDVLAVPSRSESFPLVYIESLLMGTPVVGFFPSVSELEEILDIYIGEKYDYRKDDAVALSEKIWRALNTPVDRRMIRERILERMNWDERFSEYDSIYRHVLKG